MKDDLVKSEIKSRKIVYYLTSEDDINTIKSNGIYADIFLALFSISIGGYIAVYLTQYSSEIPLNLKTSLQVAGDERGNFNPVYII